MKLDPRMKASREELADLIEENHQLALKVRDDITTLSKIVIAIQAVRKQLKERLEHLEKEKGKDAKPLIATRRSW